MYRLSVEYLFIHSFMPKRQTNVSQVSYTRSGLRTLQDSASEILCKADVKSPQRALNGTFDAIIIKRKKPHMQLSISKCCLRFSEQQCDFVNRKPTIDHSIQTSAPNNVRSQLITRLITALFLHTEIVQGDTSQVEF